ncbi:MAG TPA: TIGR02302 family protein [Stellaceae bacterium]|nr:TIGR02302 family protein [Stellaceae bacterium]
MTDRPPIARERGFLTDRRAARKRARGHDGRAPARLAIRLEIARAALLWERLWPACWPAVVILGVFAILVLFDLLPPLPPLLHAAVLLGLGAAFIVALGAGLRTVRLPDRAAARRRIERASGLEHRPLQALTDRPSRPLDPQAARLWEVHLWRMEAAARRLRVGLPAAGLATRDLWGVRVVLAILLLLGAIDAGGDWRQRLDRAVAPNLGSGTPAVMPSLEAWVTPPDYTGLPPQFLRAGMPVPVRVPTGSTLLAQVHGGDAAPDIAIDGDGHRFKTVDKENFEAKAKLTRGRQLAVTQAGTTLGLWPIAIIPDTPPKIEFSRPPGATPHAALRIDYHAADDYGVEAVAVVIRRPAARGASKSGGKTVEALKLALPLPGLHPKDAKATAYQDLAAHPWAGLPVEIRLVAIDAAGQTGESNPVQMILPERVFHNPVARAIIEQRKQLVTDPSSRLAVAEILGDLRRETHLYGGDALAFLGMRVAQEELRHQQGPQMIAEVERLLWDTALRIEDGGLSMAERALRRIERQLQDALAQGAPDAEIQRLMSELRQALDRYLQQLAKNLARHPGQTTTPDTSRLVTGRDLQRMLDQARELARSGAREQARQLLSQLQNMLENLRTATVSQQSAEQAERIMRSMRALMQRQKDLLDRSFRAARPPGAPGMMMPQLGRQQPGGDMGDAAGQQDTLRRSLDEMMRRLGGAMGRVPDPLGRAERAMRDAVGALQQGLPGEAVAPQSDALDQLQQAARELARQMENRLGGQPGYRQVPSGSPTGRSLGRDPFGRPVSDYGAFDEGDVKIPDKNTLQRAREILDELRRRAGEPTRPQIERDYIERLLKQF